MSQWPNLFLDRVWSLSYLIGLVYRHPSCKAWPTSFLALYTSFFYYFLCIFNAYSALASFLLDCWWIPGLEVVGEFWNLMNLRSKPESVSIFVTLEKVSLSSLIFLPSSVKMKLLVPTLQIIVGFRLDMRNVSRVVPAAIHILRKKMAQDFIRRSVFLCLLLFPIWVDAYFHQVSLLH